MDPVAGVVLGCGLLNLALVIQIIRHHTSSGRLDRNGAVGIRTRATRSSDQAWRAGHQAASSWLLAAAITGYCLGVMRIVFSIAVWVTAESSAAVLAIPSAGYAAVIILLLLATQRADRAARPEREHQ